MVKEHATLKTSASDSAAGGGRVDSVSHARVECVTSHELWHRRAQEK